MTAVSGEVRTKHPDEEKTYYFDFAAELDAIGETVSSIVGNAVSVSPSGLTAGTPAILAADTVVDGEQLYSDKAVLVKLSGGTKNVDYKITCTIVTSTAVLPAADKLTKVGPLQVRNE